MIVEIAALFRLFTFIIPTAVYMVLITSLVIGELLHQVYPDKYPRNIAIVYIDEKI